MGAEVTEQRADYHLKPPAQSIRQAQDKPAMISTELDTLRTKLVDIECQLISLLVTVQRALGKEPTVMTRRERRRA